MLHYYMTYFEFIDNEKNNYKFWQIENLKNAKPAKVVVKYGKIGKDGITKEFLYHNKDWGNKYMEKQIESKLKKGYVKKGKLSKIIKSTKVAKPNKVVKPNKVAKPNKAAKPNNASKKPKTVVKKDSKIDYKNKTDFPNPASFKKTSNGYSYYNLDINVNCSFKGTEPSPKGRGLCAKAVLDNQTAIGNDGNVWIKKGNRWVKHMNMASNVKKISNTKKTCHIGKVLSPKGSCVKDRKLVEKVDKEILKSKNKKTKSEALKIHDEIYKTWNKVAKKSKKMFGDEERLISHPDGLVWGYGTSQKYSDWESCIANSRPKRECNKIVTLLRKDLTEMNKALAKVDKTCPPRKVLSPSGRCVIDRSKLTKTSNTKKVKLVVKKTFPPGKVLSPKGRFVKDKTQSVVKETKKVQKGKVLYDVKKEGVMLAHTFKDPKSGKIKTAPKGTTQAPNGWFLSEKYDGYRAIWNGQEFVSRNGNIYPTPPEFKKWLPPNVALDGELFMGRENFEKCGLFRKKEAKCEEWKKANVTYQIFDSPTMSGMFEERTSKIQKLIKEQCKKHSGKCPLIITKQIKVKTEEDVYKHFNKLVAKLISLSKVNDNKINKDK